MTAGTAPYDQISYSTLPQWSRTEVETLIARGIQKRLALLQRKQRSQEAEAERRTAATEAAAIAAARHEIAAEAAARAGTVAAGGGEADAWDAFARSVAHAAASLQLAVQQLRQDAAAAANSMAAAAVESAAAVAQEVDALATAATTAVSQLGRLQTLGGPSSGSADTAPSLSAQLASSAAAAAAAASKQAAEQAESEAAIKARYAQTIAFLLDAIGPCPRRLLDALSQVTPVTDEQLAALSASGGAAMPGAYSAPASLAMTPRVSKMQ